MPAKKGLQVPGGPPRPRPGPSLGPDVPIEYPSREGSAASNLENATMDSSPTIKTTQPSNEALLGPQPVGRGPTNDTSVEYGIDGIQWSHSTDSNAQSPRRRFRRRRMSHRSQRSHSTMSRDVFSLSGSAGGRMSEKVSSGDETAESTGSTSQSSLGWMRNRKKGLVGVSKESVILMIETKAFKIFFFVAVVVDCMARALVHADLVRARAGFHLQIVICITWGLFAGEMVGKICGYRIQYFLSAWNILDMIAVLVGLIRLITVLNDLGEFTFGETDLIRLLRLMRYLTTLHTITNRSIRLLSMMKILLKTLRSAMRTLIIIAGLMFYFVFVFAIIGDGLYGEVDEKFSGLDQTLWTLFETLTLDDWSILANNISKKGHAHYYAFIIIFIFVEVFIFAGLFVAVLVDSFQLSIAREKASLQRHSRKDMVKFRSNDDEEEEEADKESLAESREAVMKEEERGYTTTDDDFDEEDEAEKFKKVDDYYTSHDEEELKLMEQYYLLLAAFDNQLFKLSRHMRHIELMVEVADLGGEVI